jgi:hypothetical protein
MRGSASFDPILQHWQQQEVKALRWLLHTESDPRYTDILRASDTEDWEAVLGMVRRKRGGLRAPLLLQGAVQQQNSRALQSLVHLKIQPSKKEVYQAILAAAQLGHPRCLKVLLHFRAQYPLVVDMRFLMAAVQKGHRRCVQLLLQHQPHLVNHSYDTRRAVTTAAADGDWHTLKVLLDHHECLPDGMAVEALFNAAYRGHIACARLLVPRYKLRIRLATPWIRSTYDNSLKVAAKAGDWQMVELLLQAGVYTSAGHRPALHMMPNTRAAADADERARGWLYPSRSQAPLYYDASTALEAEQGCQGGADSAGTGASDTGSDSEVEFEDPSAEYEREVALSQTYTPSRSRAAVLLIRAGAKVDLEDVAALKELALSEGNAELKELMSKYVTPSWLAAWQLS